MLPGERPDREECPVEEARVERDERAVRELVVDELEVGAQQVPLELREVDLECTCRTRQTPSARICLRSPGRLIAVVLDALLGERQ